MELKGTKTEQNLWTAFAGESQARVKYGYYASAAKKEGYNQISAIFEETSGKFATGHAPNYVKVYVPGNDLHNRVLPVRVTGLWEDGVTGTLEIEAAECYNGENSVGTDLGRNL